MKRVAIKVTIEVIDNVNVVRYNGNNCPGSREGGEKTSPWASKAWSKGGRAWGKAKGLKKKEAAKAKWLTARGGPIGSTPSIQLSLPVVDSL